jgi:hypothetical protein
MLFVNKTLEQINYIRTDKLLVNIILFMRYVLNCDNQVGELVLTSLHYNKSRRA